MAWLGKVSQFHNGRTTDWGTADWKGVDDRTRVLAHSGFVKIERRSREASAGGLITRCW
jgi:hypothetical protein